MIRTCVSCRASRFAAQVVIGTDIQPEDVGKGKGTSNAMSAGLPARLQGNDQKRMFRTSAAASTPGPKSVRCHT